MAQKPTIAISHLGCEKNRIDSEHMLGLLAQAGYQVNSNEELADYVVVNTCSFIQAAREESVKTLVELAEADKKIVITGCMAQHFQSELLEEIPEAVAVVGSADYHKIVDVIQRVETGENEHDLLHRPHRRGGGHLQSPDVESHFFNYRCSGHGLNFFNQTSHEAGNSANPGSFRYRSR